jgi:hypothetical protein
VDPQDKVHIVRRDLSYNLHYHTNASGSWQGAQINGNLQGQIDTDSLTVNAQGDLLLAYNAHTGANVGNVRYACLFKSQTQWQTGAVMSGNSRTGQYFSIAFKSDRTAMILFDHFTGAGSPSYASPDNPRQLQYATAVISPPAAAPTLAASSADSLTSTSARISCEVLGDGGAAITARGVLVSVTQTNPDPQLGGTGVTNTSTPGTTGAFSLTVDGLTASTGYSFRAYATNSVGTSYGEVGTFTTQPGVPRSHQQEWRFDNFGAYDSENAGDAADPDGDGLGNFVEYALGLDPNAPNVMPAVLVLNGANLEYTYSRDSAAKENGVAYQIEWSDTLEAGSWSSETVVEQILSTEAALETVKASVPAGSGGKRFLRLRVTAPIGDQ